jgi:cytochrome c oxidase assembly factor CtaG
MSLEEFYNGKVPGYVKGAGKSYIKIAVGSEWREGKTLKVKLSDVIQYYKTEAPNITSGIRTLAGWADDWRGIDAIAHECLEYFKSVNIDGLRKAAVAEGLTPKF